MALAASLGRAVLAAAVLVGPPGGEGAVEEGLGVLAGYVRVAGRIPEALEVTVAKDRGTCGVVQEVRVFEVDRAGGLAGAAVLLPDLEGPARPAAAIDNVGCRFAPAVQVVSPGALLSIRNSDRILHSAHAIDERGATRFHVALPVFREETRAIVGPAGFLRVRCDAGHPWMRAGIVVTGGPAVVTDSAGFFRIAGVPPGTHRLLLWHDGLGLRERAMTVLPGQETRIEWAVEVPAARAR